MTRHPAGTAVEVRYRRPVDADHATISGSIEEWWDGRNLRHLLPRLWLQHFTGTSWLAEDVDDRIVGFLVGFISPDDPTTGYVHLLGVDPNHRRTGVGRELYQRFIEDVRDHGVTRVTAITWPGNRRSVAFHEAIGFRVVDGPGTMRLYGTPAFPDYEADEDRVVFERSI